MRVGGAPGMARVNSQEEEKTEAHPAARCPVHVLLQQEGPHHVLRRGQHQILGLPILQNGEPSKLSSVYTIQDWYFVTLTDCR